MDNNYALDWDSEIAEEGSAFTLLPEGDYDFTVEKFERATFDGSEKTPACKMAKVTITVWGAEDKISVVENFMLLSKFEWKLSALFLSVGLKKHGEPLRMNWSALPGAKGRCHVYIDKYKKKDGSDGESNKVKKFYAYDEDVNTVQPIKPPTQPVYNSQPATYTAAAAQSTQGGWQLGKF